MKKLYVGNLPFELTEDEFTQVFSACGTVEEVKLVTDRDTGRPRGFGFVSMSDDAGANKAISELNGKDVGGRKIVVNEARERTSGGGGHRGGGGGGYDRRR